MESVWRSFVAPARRSARNNSRGKAASEIRLVRRPRRQVLRQDVEAVATDAAVAAVAVVAAEVATTLPS